MVNGTLHDIQTVDFYLSPKTTITYFFIRIQVLLWLGPETSGEDYDLEHEISLDVEFHATTETLTNVTLVNKSIYKFCKTIISEKYLTRNKLFVTRFTN